MNTKNTKNKKTVVVKKNNNNKDDGLSLNIQKKQQSLADEISMLVTSNAPKSIDPETSDFFGDSNHMHMGNDLNNDFGDIEDDNDQSVRLRGDLPTVFTTGKYAGKKSSRRDDIDDDDQVDEQVDDDDDQDIEDKFEFEERIVSNNIDKADELLRQLEEQEDEDEDEANQQPSITTKNMATSALEELEKAKNTKNQSELFDEFLTTRIHLQKAVNIANRLPKPSDHKMMVEAETKIGEAFTSAANEAKSLLSDLFDMQSELISRNSEIEQCAEKKTTRKRLRDTESLSDIWSAMEEQNARLFEYTSQTLEKWNSRVNVSANVAGVGGAKQGKSLKAINQSVMTQVNNTLNDFERLQRRTRLRRSTYTIIGQQQQQQQQQVQTDGKRDDYDDEVFDDMDFYQILLKEIEKTSAEAGQVQVGSDQWREMQALKKKNKKKAVNTKSSKDRMLKYETFQKLENFMPPVPAPMPPWNIDQLFSTLFGGIGVGGGLSS
ncbi:hypothetical protein SAMD00019534_048200 [Acytostelium subglobosum LB1]|uniref:hypothetical protein n=1 Tax=Acytostelium subglobosum LB1 TaxID=1410327 RepID=UPI000644E3D8|nr:hypothetical protein SAMD00019534_048200 [Acytostelium subglobosum LB1]GAM21645.1 hypothetical protein SAMD00019534_048200 [Acytostelium subglobosum LB1]|eukprot:XP_012755764.1 hypothetical protein SAMD00019534_048200 [Acytostelium subglobosum LB1]